MPSQKFRAVCFKCYNPYITSNPKGVSKRDAEREATSHMNVYKHEVSVQPVEDKKIQESSDILYQNGDYDVRPAQFGKTKGFAVYKHEGTHAVKVASIGYEGQKGLSRAIAEVDKRAGVHEALRLPADILPLCEMGPSGITRMQVQNFYDNQRKLGVSIRDAMRATEFALNIKDLQTDSSGQTVVFFTEGASPFNMTEDQAVSHAKDYFSRTKKACVVKDDDGNVVKTFGK